MGIDVEEGMKSKDLYKHIINKVCLYVDLITGKNKKSLPLSGAIIDPEPYNNILKYTSYSFVTGDPGLSRGEWIKLKEAARKGKAAIAERAKMMGKKAKANSSAVSSLTNQKNGASLKSLTKRIKKVGDAGVLKDASFEQLLELSGRFGIDPSKYKDINKLKAAIYMAMGAEVKRVDKLNKKTGITQTPITKNVKKRKQKLDPITGKPLFDSDGKPILEDVLDANGNPVMETINVGQKTTFKKRKFRKRRNEIDLLSAHNDYGTSDILNLDTDNPLIKSYKETEDDTEEVVTPTDPTVMLDIISKNVLGIHNLITEDNTVNKEISSVLQNHSTTFGYYYGNLDIHTNLSEINNTNKELLNRSDTTNSLLDSIVNISTKNIEKYLKDINKSIELNTTAFKDSIISSSKKMVPLITKFDNVKDLAGSDTAVPVYVVNMVKNTGGEDGHPKYTEGIGGNVSNVEAYQDRNGQVRTNGRNDVLFTKDANTILQEMQSRGYTPTSRYIQRGVAQAGHSYKVSDADLKWAMSNNFKFASGAYSFIAGDSLNKSPNPELVTIKSDGSFSVNPLKESTANGYSKMALDTKIDKFATGGSGGIDNRAKLLLTPYEKLQKELQFINAKSSLANMASQAGLNPDEFGIMSATSEKQLDKITKKIVKAIQRKKKAGAEEKENSKISSEAQNMGLSTVSKTAIMPVYVVNKSLGMNDGSIKGAVDSVRSSVETNMSNLMLTLGGPWAVTAPMGVGAITNPLMIGTGVADKIMDTAVDVMDTAKSVLGQTLFSATGGRITKAATGGTVKRTGRGMPRFSTGGSSIITGDAMGSNIFAGGAKPELVQTDGNTTVTPLNKTGTEQRYKIDRMTSTERNSALATAISSHIVKYNYTLPSEASEVSNSGEAIKVFSVKPGITDVIDVAGEQTTLAALLANIYGQLALIAGNTGTGNELLTAIASKPVANVSGGGGGNTDSNPFAGGFPSSLDGILGGE